MTTKAKQTDKRIYDILWEIEPLKFKLEKLVDETRRAGGQRYDWQNKSWSGPWSELLISTDPWVVQRLEEIKSVNHQLSLLKTEYIYLEKIWQHEKWSRFYLVVGTGQGHIHKDMNCHSCYPTTEYAWLPELSGDSEAEAVAAEGEILCTFCFPTAPVAWCEGVGRRTQEAKDAAAAVKAERQAAKAAKSLSLDGDEVVIRCDRNNREVHSWSKAFKTMRAAELWVTEALAWKTLKALYPTETYIGFGPDAYDDANLESVLEMMAQKKGIEVAEILAANAKKVEKKVNEERKWVDEMLTRKALHQQTQS
jgi:hypothetical protein